MRRLTLFLSLICCTLTGCPATPTNGPKAVTNKEAKSVAENPETLKPLGDLGGKWKTDNAGRIIELDLRGTTASDSTLEHVAKLTSLRSLLLNDTKVTDNGMDLVGAMKTLTNLDLRGCDVSNRGIDKLAGLTELKAFRLSGKSGVTNNVDDDAMETIGKFTKLKVLALDFLKFTGSAEGLEQLIGLTNLEELYVGNTLIDDAALGVTARQFPKLKKLRAAASQISDLGMSELERMTNLEELDLSENSQIFDGGMSYLAAMTKLKKLNFWRVQITDEGVQHLAGLKNLEWLNLDNITYLSDEGLVHLKDLTNLKFLHLGSTAISDDGLVHLEQLTALDDLKVTRTSVTEEGAEKLKKKLTKTKIQLEYEGKS